MSEEETPPKRITANDIVTDNIGQVAVALYTSLLLSSCNFKDVDDNAYADDFIVRRLMRSYPDDDYFDIMSDDSDDDVMKTRRTKVHKVIEVFSGLFTAATYIHSMSGDALNGWIPSSNPITIELRYPYTKDNALAKLDCTQQLATKIICSKQPVRFIDAVIGVRNVCESYRTLLSGNVSDDEVNRNAVVNCLHQLQDILDTRLERYDIYYYNNRDDDMLIAISGTMHTVSKSFLNPWRWHVC